MGEGSGSGWRWRRCCSPPGSRRSPRRSLTSRRRRPSGSRFAPTAPRSTPTTTSARSPATAASSPSSRSAGSPRATAPASEDVFRHDRKTGKTRRVSLKSNGKQVPGGERQRLLDLQGRPLRRLPRRGGLRAGGQNGNDDVYVKDMKTGKVRRASVLSNGSELPYNSLHPAISGNGRFVAFDSEVPSSAPTPTGSLTSSATT